MSVSMVYWNWAEGRVPWCIPAEAAPLWNPTLFAVSSSPVPAQQLSSATSAGEPHPDFLLPHPAAESTDMGWCRGEKEPFCKVLFSVFWQWTGQSST